MAASTDMQRSLSQVDRIWLAVPYALLVISTGLTWVVDELSRAQSFGLIGAALAVIIWHTWWAVAHPQWLETRVVPMVVYYVGLVALTAYLFHLTFNFFPLYLACFPMAFVALPGRWAYGGVGLATVVALLGPELLSWNVENVIVTLAAGTLAAVAGGSIRALEAETARRRAAMAELSQTHTELERALADNLALQGRLVIEARDAGVAAERTRLAGEIHDTLAAGLAGIVSQLEALDAQMDPESPLQDRVRTSTEVARESLQEARRSVRALRPGVLIGSGLPAALRDLAGRWQRTADVPVEVCVTGTAAPVPAAVEDALVRAASEALTNISRHAEANRVHLTLSYLDATALALDISDDGRGLSSTNGSGSGHGLSILRERISGLGGQVDVSSTSGHGTTVTVTVPLPPVEPAR